MKIAALYARVSSTRQQQNENIASQIDALLAFAKSNNYQVSPQHIFQDDGISGTYLDRPALEQLRDTVAAGELEAVIILSPDRLARQFAYQYLVTEEFERAGCKVIFLDHGFGDTPQERMLLEMTGVFSEYERAQISERCRRGRLFRARQGGIWMSQAPYGYTYIRRTDSCPSKLVINETEADVVRQIFRWLVDEQLSTYQIHKKLNESGIYTRHGKARWSGGYLVNLLRNPIYTGTYYYNKRRGITAQRRNMPATKPAKPLTGRVWREKEEWIPIEVPAIIDMETFELAKEQLKLNRERAPRNNKKYDYLLKSLLVCVHCGLRMVGNGGPNRNRRYMCARKESQYVHPEGCPSRSVLADTLEGLVWDHIKELLSDAELLNEQYLLRQDDSYGTVEEKEQARLEKKLSALKGVTRIFLIFLR